MVRGADEEDGAQAGESRGRDQRGGGALTRHPKAIRARRRAGAYACGLVRAAAWVSEAQMTPCGCSGCYGF